MTNAIGLTILTALFNCELIYRIATFTRPLRANQSATAFTGPFRRWRLTHVTGRVLHYTGYTDTKVTVELYSDNSERTTVTTNRHQTVTLQRVDGTRKDVEVVNYNVNFVVGDVVSIWYALKGGKGTTLAVLNHPANRQYVNAQDVFKILQPHQTFFVIWLCLAVLPVSIVSVFGGWGLPLLFWLICLMCYALGQKRLRRGFARRGIGPMWQKGTAEAQQFRYLQHTSDTGGAWRS